MGIWISNRGSVPSFDRIAHRFDVDNKFAAHYTSACLFEIAFAAIAITRPPAARGIGAGAVHRFCRSHW
jgi:hypothetical protein